MAFPGNTAWYSSTAAYALVAQWAANTAYVVGDIVRQLATPTLGNERTFVCIVAGTSHATTEPTWTVTRGAKNTDNTVTWQECSAIAGMNGDVVNTPTWTVGAKNQSISLGHVIKSGDGTKLLICTTAGTAGNGAEPSWSGSVGGTTGDGAGALVWTTLKISSNKFANWASPAARVGISNATNWGDAVGQKYFVSSDHAESTTGSGSIFSNRGSVASPMMMLSVDRTGSVPPTAADLEVGATLESTSDTNMDVNGWFELCYGLTFKAGDSGVVSIRPTAVSDRYFQNCTFWLNSTSNSASFSWGFTSNHGRWRFKGCKFRFGATGQSISAGGGAVEEYIDCTIDPAGSVPSQLFENNGQGSVVHCIGCDWSAVTGTLAGVGAGQTNGHEWFFEGCKINASVTPFAFAGSTATANCWGLLDRCDSGATNYKTWWQTFVGTMKDNIEVIRTGSAEAPDSQNFSWSMASNANCTDTGCNRFDSLKMHSYNSTVGGDVTITVYGVANTAAMPLDNEVFIDVTYSGDASSPKLTHVSTVGDIIGTSAANLTADTSAWDTGATARQNSHAYTVGQIIKLGTNTGRIFFCTTAGTSAGSEPGGYASAVDGDAITDGTAVFRAGWRFKIATTLTSPDQPQLAGNITTRISLAVVSTTIYVDPSPVLS